VANDALSPLSTPRRNPPMQLVTNTFGASLRKQGEHFLLKATD
jgi:hypothetical protein